LPNGLRGLGFFVPLPCSSTSLAESFTRSSRPEIRGEESTFRSSVSSTLTTTSGELPPAFFLFDFDLDLPGVTGRLLPASRPGSRSRLVRFLAAESRLLADSEGSPLSPPSCILIVTRAGVVSDRGDFRGESSGGDLEELGCEAEGSGGAVGSDEAESDGEKSVVAKKRSCEWLAERD